MRRPLATRSMGILLAGIVGFGVGSRPSIRASPGPETIASGIVWNEFPERGGSLPAARSG